MQRRDVQLPHTSPVGLAVVPESFDQTPRRHTVLLRVSAAILAGVVLAVVFVTTAVSLGGYCLTTDTANTSALPPRYLAGSR